MKRIIGKLLLENESVLNSYRFEDHRPCGSLEHALVRLEEWQVDEILILNRTNSYNPASDFIRLFKINALPSLRTPVTYGGGVGRLSEAELEELIGSGIERLVISIDSPEYAKTLSSFTHILGAQALVLHIPFLKLDGTFVTRPSRLANKLRELSEISFELGAWSGEVLLTDSMSDGGYGCRESVLAEAANLFRETNVIVGGGISSALDVANLLMHEQIGAVSIGNFINRNENAIQKLRTSQIQDLVRKP